jgi:ABC-type microcin C transport system permease subunit YejB
VRAYLLRRLWQSALTLVGVSLLVFVILRVIPGDPAKMLLPEGAPQSAVEALNRELGLREVTGLGVDVKLVAPHTIPRSEGKAVRVVERGAGPRT